jgi:peptide/nickel transport system substrate-binding protein
VKIAEQELRYWMCQVVEGMASRRQFMRTLCSLGLTSSVIAHLLATTTPAAVQGKRLAPSAFMPAARGGGGKLRLLWWQAPTMLNFHLSSGTKDVDASRIVYEPLFSINPDGDFIPILVEQIPSFENGDLSRDGIWVTWRLKRGVVWHDGTPFTADDVIFTWEYATNPATGATSTSLYENILRIDKLNDHAITVVFKEPTPVWFLSGRGHILPKHLFAAYKGQHARNAPYNLNPVGTGPYKIIAFKPGDVVLYEMNPHYHVPNRPFFGAIELKGGGDAPSAARAVIQTGEFDFAWNIQVEKDVLKWIEQQGRHGRIDISPSAYVEHIQFNRTDPWTEVDGERSSLKVPHPFLTDLQVRQALAEAIDRHTIAAELYGPMGQPTSNFLNLPTRFQSPNARWEFNLEKAGKLLDQAGWQRGSDGFRVKDGRRLKILFQTSMNLVRQKTQAIVKKAWEQIGIEVELKAVNAGVYFSSDPGNPNTFSHFYADVQMYSSATEIDPQASMRSFVSWEIAQKANHWAGRNVVRWANAEYDWLWKQAETELDPVRRAALFIRMNDLLLENVVVIPVIWRNWISATNHSLRGMALGPWDSDLWNLAYWYRQA